MSNVTRLSRPANVTSIETIKERIGNLQQRLWNLRATLNLVHVVVRDGSSIDGSTQDLLEGPLELLSQQLDQLHSDMDAGFIVRIEEPAADSA